jgi:hypothetical protein
MLYYLRGCALLMIGLALGCGDDMTQGSPCGDGGAGDVRPIEDLEACLPDCITKLFEGCEPRGMCTSNSDISCFENGVKIIQILDRINLLKAARVFRTGAAGENVLCNYRVEHELDFTNAGWLWQYYDQGSNFLVGKVSLPNRFARQGVATCASGARYRINLDRPQCDHIPQYGIAGLPMLYPTCRAGDCSIGRMFQ